MLEKIMMDYIKKGLAFVLDKRGLTLVELLAVIVIIGILSSIAVISTLGLVENTEEEVCVANRRQLEKDYSRDLALNEIDHSESQFNSYVLRFGEVCPVGGHVVFVNGHIECSVHVGEKETGEQDGDGVPFL
jgi:prepilin-type N-terminal cleavage/methylation domain-containing protein